MKRLALIFAMVLGLTLPLAADPDVSGKQVMYLGGSIAPPAEGTIGEIDLTHGESFLFQSSAGRIEIPYAQIRDIQYGQKLKRKLPLLTGAAVRLILRPRKKRHFVSIRFSDDGAEHVVLFEIPKTMATSVTTVLEARTGRRIRPLTR